MKTEIEIGSPELQCHWLHNNNTQINRLTCSCELRDFHDGYFMFAQGQVYEFKLYLKIVPKIYSKA